MDVVEVKLAAQVIVASTDAFVVIVVVVVVVLGVVVVLCVVVVVVLGVVVLCVVVVVVVLGVVVDVVVNDKDVCNFVVAVTSSTVCNVFHVDVIVYAGAVVDNSDVVPVEYGADVVMDIVEDKLVVQVLVDSFVS
jgi:hypothetical protein